jgi:hypothetical protein
MNTLFDSNIDAGLKPHPVQVSFESDRVKSVLTHFKLTASILDLVKDQQAQTGEKRLTFASFRRRFPAFPIYLEARWQSRVGGRCPPARLFRNFEDTFLLPTYLEVYANGQAEAQGRPIGLIVPFDGYRGGMLIHNGVYDTRNTRMIHDVHEDVPPYRVTIEPVVNVLKFLARSGWTPKSPLPSQRAVQGPNVRHGGRLYPWIVRSLGAGPDAIILAWLYTVLHTTSGYDRLYVTRVGHDERAVTATHVEIAAATGLSERQVKRGLATLHAKQFISPRAPGERGQIRLDRQAMRRARASQRRGP